MRIDSEAIEQAGADLRLCLDDMVEIIVVFGQIVVEGGYAAANRDARFMHRVAAAADQMVPPVEIVALGNQPVGAGRRKPVDRPDGLGGQLHAIRHDRPSIVVILAAAGSRIKQAASHGGPVDFACVLVLELGQAAFAAAVAKRLPLLGRHRLERQALPERGFHEAAFGPRDPPRQAVGRPCGVQRGFIWRVLPGF